MECTQNWVNKTVTIKCKEQKILMKYAWMDAMNNSLGKLWIVK
jgi:hypothetical protein